MLNRLACRDLTSLLVLKRNSHFFCVGNYLLIIIESACLTY